MRHLTLATIVALSTLAFSSAFGQATDGNITGTVLDPSGAAVQGASVIAQNIGTGIKTAAKTGPNGIYRIDNLLVGTYSVTTSAPGFTTTTIDHVEVELNKITTLNLKLQVGNVSTVVEISEVAASIDTTTAQISNSYTGQMARELPVSANPTQGILNLSLLGAGVSSAGGVGIGTGPSIGGQRPRNNSFNIEGIDNNRKDVTGPVVSVPNDAVTEFTLLQNQFSAEYGHSSGGQFNTVLDSGTNKIHGGIWEYLDNRDLNAYDQSFSRQYVGQTLPNKPRYDRNRLGAKIGGDIIKNKLFYFGSYEYSPLGQSSVSTPIYAPTAAGYSTLGTISTFNQTNFNIMKTYLQPAPVQSKTINVCNASLPTQIIGTTQACPAANLVSIPIGILPVVAPNFNNTYRYVISVDYNLSDKDQFRGRYIDNKQSGVDTAAALPIFFTPLPVTGHLGSFSEFHNFTPAVNNEFRLAYNRYNNNFGLPNFNFPGLDIFPNLQINDLNNLQIGPGPNDPQATIQNTYQLVDNLAWNKGKHDLKFGIDARDLIAASTFIQRARGDYEYTTLSNYLHDISPDYLAQRNVGGRPYSGNQTAFSAYANDNWKITPNLTINLGIRYEFNGVAQSMQLFNLDAAASTPGYITFKAPTSQKSNFAPRIGFAYSPGSSARTSIRGGFGIAYDQIFDNVGTNATPPQASATVNADPTQYPTGGFLAHGGILPTALAANPTVAQLKSLSTSYLPDQEMGYAINWNFGIQHVFAKDYTIDVRYLGNRGVHLLFQNQINKISLVSPTHSLPTYMSAPSQAVLDSLPLTLAQLSANSNVNNNMWYSLGYLNAITGYLPIGNSSYEGMAVDFSKRFSQHLLYHVAYTFSHLIDDSTAEVNSTALTPRRPQDFQNLNAERASSALDHRNRLTLTTLYEVPWFTGNSNWFKKNILGNYQVSFVYTAETGELATPQSAVDTNFNGDSATDRVIINPSGTPGTSSDVTVLKNSAGATVAYLAINPNAQYIRAAQGAYPNAGRNLLPTPAINNFDFNVVKIFSIREWGKFELRADFFNGLNHPQYTAGAVNNINQTQRVGVTSFLTPGNPLFGAYDQVWSSNPRNIQVGMKLTF
jgi:hypothetical protein